MKNLLLFLGFIVLVIGYCGYKALMFTSSVVDTVTSADDKADVHSLLRNYDFDGARESINNSTDLSSADAKILRLEIDSMELIYTNKRSEGLAIAKTKLQKLHDERDDFEGLTWYRHKSSPRYTNQNGLYIYFALDDSLNIERPLRWAIQHHANDWIFFDRIAFNLDGEKIEYTPIRVATDTDDGGKVLEWIDWPIDDEELEIIEKIIHSKSSKMRLYGSKGQVDKEITDQQKEAMSAVLEVYLLLGGTIS